MGEHLERTEADVMGQVRRKPLDLGVADIKGSALDSIVYAVIVATIAGEVLPALVGVLDPLVAPLLCEHTWERSGRSAFCSGVDMSMQILAFELVAWWLVLFLFALLRKSIKNRLAQRVDAKTKSRWGRVTAVAEASFFTGPMVAIVVGVFFPALFTVAGPVICDDALTVGSSTHSYKPGQSGVYHGMHCGADDVTFQAVAITCLAFYIAAFSILGVISLVRSRISRSSVDAATS